MHRELPYLKKNGKYILKPFLQKNTRRIEPLKPINSKDLLKVVSPKTFYKEYDALSFFVDGMARVKINGKLTYIDYNENQLNLQGNCVRLMDFKNGIAQVKKEDGYWYFINKNGIEVNKQGYENIKCNDYGFYIAMTSFGTEEVLDKAGNLINLGNKGRSTSSTSFDYVCISQTVILVSYPNNSYKAFDYTGKEVFSTKDYRYISDFWEGFAMAITRQYVVVIINDRLDIIKELTDVYEKEFDGFVEGFCIIRKKEYDRLINVAGETICEYPSIFYAGGGVFAVGKNIDGNIKYSFLNSSFKEVTAFKYDTIDNFSEGVGAYCVGKKWGLITTEGNEITNAEYAKLGKCVNGFIEASYGDYKGGAYYGRYGFLNKEGKKICSIIYDEVYDFESNRIAIVKLNGFYGLLNEEGKEITRLQYDSIDEHQGDCYFVTLGDYRFIIDDTGCQFAEEQYYRNLNDASIIVSDANLPL